MRGLLETAVRMRIAKERDMRGAASEVDLEIAWYTAVFKSLAYSGQLGTLYIVMAYIVMAYSG